MDGYKVPARLIESYIEKMYAFRETKPDYFAGMNDVIESIEGLGKEELDNPWHTGTPTEEGYYLVQLRGYYYKDTIGKIVAKWERNWWRTIHVGSYANLEEDIKAWMPIELHKETDNICESCHWYQQRGVRFECVHELGECDGDRFEQAEL